MSLSCAWSQNLSKSESKSLQAFISQPSAKGGNNGEALGFQGGNVANIPGITVSNGHVTDIKWDGKDLGGSLDLSAFPALQKVDISNNKIKNLSVAYAPSLVELNASKNRISEISLQGCDQLQTLRLNRNRLSEIDLSGTPFLKKAQCIIQPDCRFECQQCSEPYLS